MYMTKLLTRFQLYSKNLSLQQHFTTKALQYTATLSLKFVFAAMCPLVMSPYSRGLIKHSYNISI